MPRCLAFAADDVLLSGRRSAVEVSAARLILGQEGRQFGRREVDFGGLGVVWIAGQWCYSIALRIHGTALDSPGIGHAGRQPIGGVVARRPVETDAGGAFRGIEGGFQRRGEFRLLVTA